MLATLVPEAFDDPAWGFEPKWDGIRTIAVCDTATRLISRNARDVTAAYPELHSLHDRVVALEAVIDGEIVAMDEGRPSFQRLQQRMHVRDTRRVERLAQAIPVTFMAFDLLYLDGEDLTTLALTERRRRLKEVVVPSENLQLSPVIEGDGRALFEAARQQGLEGIVAKRLDSRYEPGARSRNWLKVKVVFDADVVVAGWTEGEGRREGTLGSLVMAVYDQGRLRYVGNVGTGFDAAALADALHRLRRLSPSEPPFPPDVIRSRPELRQAHWVSPELIAKVEHRQLTDAGRLRAPSFQGFREDKDPTDCTYDQLL
jgi:bifunctional non-homologous end joining protein LigD